MWRKITLQTGQGMVWGNNEIHLMNCFIFVSPYTQNVNLNAIDKYIYIYKHKRSCQKSIPVWGIFLTLTLSPQRMDLPKT